MWTARVLGTITGSGVTLTPDNGNSTDTQAIINYSIAAGTATGARTITLSNSFGPSKGATFTVGDPPAIVNAVTPSLWVAGMTYSVQITGSGFGTAPKVAIPGTGLTVGLPTNTAPDGTSTQVTVTVAANAPDQEVTVTVTPGYTGSSYACNCTNGQSPTGSGTANVSATAVPPLIQFVGSTTNIANTTQQIFAGQQVALQVSAPSGFTISNPVWALQNP
jgi:hypothetical protein